MCTTKNYVLCGRIVTAEAEVFPICRPAHKAFEIMIGMLRLGNTFRMECPSWLTVARASNEWQAPTCQIAATFRTKLPQAVRSIEYLSRNSTPLIPWVQWHSNRTPLEQPLSKLEIRKSFITVRVNQNILRCLLHVLKPS